MLPKIQFVKPTGRFIVPEQIKHLFGNRPALPVMPLSDSYRSAPPHVIAQFNATFPNGASPPIKTKNIPPGISSIQSNKTHVVVSTPDPISRSNTDRYSDALDTTHRKKIEVNESSGGTAQVVKK